jgi:hypothetical protein
MIHADQRNLFLVVFAFAVVISGAILVFLVRRTILLFSDQSHVRPGWQRTTILALALQATAVAAFFTAPALSFLQLLIFMAIVDWFEEMILRPRIVGRIFDPT